MSALSDRHASAEVQLERLIDADGLGNVLARISYVCGEKSEHIDIQWQDKKLAAQWMKAAVWCDQLASKINKKLDI